MAIINIEKITIGRATYVIAAYDTGAVPAGDGLKVRFEQSDGRFIDITLSNMELDSIAEWHKTKHESALVAKGG